MSKKEYISVFPTLQEFKDDYCGDEAESDRIDFYRDWCSHNTARDCMSDHTGESWGEDEDDLVEQWTDEELYETMLQDAIDYLYQQIRDNIPKEDIEKLMSPKRKKALERLRLIHGAIQI